jgi:hypothetical protein
MNEREIKIIEDKLSVDYDDLDLVAEDKAAHANRKLDLLMLQTERQLSNIEGEVIKIREKFSKEVAALKNHFTHEIARTRSGTKKVRSHQAHLQGCVHRLVAAKDKEIEKLKKELEAARAAQQSEQIEMNVPKLDPRAATFAIYDSIIFAISNWSTDGDTAPDFELACQSILFPVVYERVMRGEDDYYIEEVPCSAMEIVKRGREYVKMLRSTCEGSLVAPDVWESHAGMVQEWWVRDALPMLYGARSNEWDEDNPLSLLEVLEWRDQPASRALHFPLIFDGMALVEKNRDLIRESTGLPAFNKTTLQTRLQP